MYVCLYVCKYPCMYVCMLICTLVCLNMCVCMCVYAYTLKFDIYSHAFINNHIDVSIPTYKDIYIYIYLSIYIFIHLSIYLSIYQSIYISIFLLFTNLSIYLVERGGSCCVEPEDRGPQVLLRGHHLCAEAVPQRPQEHPDRPADPQGPAPVHRGQVK